MGSKNSLGGASAEISNFAPAHLTFSISVKAVTQIETCSKSLKSLRTERLNELVIMGRKARNLL